MALFKPKTTTPTNFYGACEISILNYTDKSKEYDWADIYLDIEIKQKGSDYTKSIRLAGSFEKGPDGSITGGSVLNRLYHFFDIVGIEAGVNAKGEWETATGEPIKDIAKYLNDGYVAESNEPKSFPYLAYVYKEQPKQAGGKVYTRVHHKLNHNSPEGRKRLEEDVKWFKSKGFLKEVKEDSPNAVSQEELENVFGSDAMSNM
mgnify:FL=1|tara:strand:+ start:204 stop:815 length:612 start_codon:yes stop_codon:yes gene_type:complete